MDLHQRSLSEQSQPLRPHPSTSSLNNNDNTSHNNDDINVNMDEINNTDNDNNNTNNNNDSSNNSNINININENNNTDTNNNYADDININTNTNTNINTNSSNGNHLEANGTSAVVDMTAAMNRRDSTNDGAEIMHSDSQQSLDQLFSPGTSGASYTSLMDNEDSRERRDTTSRRTQNKYIPGDNQTQIESLVGSCVQLAKSPTNKHLFDVLVDDALKSLNPKLDGFEMNFAKLRERDLDKDPFVVVATLGQELFNKQYLNHAAIILEHALILDTDNKRLKSSVLSTTSYVLCAIGGFKRALTYMKRELKIETELNDVSGQCRVLSNIGYTYYKLGKFVESLEAHREQLKLAIQNKLHQQAAQAFNATGHVHVARNDFANALTSHQWCLNMLSSLGENEFDQFKELLAIGHVNSLLTDYRTSEERYKEAMQLLDSSTTLKKEERQVGSIMVHFNLAHLALKRQSLMETVQHYESVIGIARDMEVDQKRFLYELRALSGLGHTYRVFQRFSESKKYFERQLELARKVQSQGFTLDPSSQSQALSNLGMAYQHFKDYSTASRLFEENMQLVGSDPLLKAYAHSYRASLHSARGDFSKAHEEYEKSLKIFRELEQCSAERKTIELNMEAISGRLGRSQISLISNTARSKRNTLMA